MAALCWIEAHPGLAGYIQAFGAIAAIAISVWLAVSSARREREAEAAANRRMEAADRAEVEREAARDRAADARMERAKIESHNALINKVTSLGLLATDQCQDIATSARVRYAAVTGSFHGSGFASTRVDELRNALPGLKAETGDLGLLEAIAVLQDAIELEDLMVSSGGHFVDALDAKLQRIFSALENIESERR